MLYVKYTKSIHFFKLTLGYSRKNPHPPTDGISENLAGGGFKGLGNPDGRGG